MPATLLALISCLIWSSAVLVASILSARFGPLTASGLELLLAGFILLAYAIAKKQLPSIFKNSLRTLFICGTFWVLNSAFFWLAVGATRSKEELVVVGLLNYLWPSLTLLFAIPILKKKPTWWLVPGILAVLGGIVLGKMATNPSVTWSTLTTELNVWAYSCAAIDALAWALYSNLSRKLSHPEGGSGVPFYMLAAGFILLVGALRTEPWQPLTFENGALLIAWSVSTACTYLFWDIGMRKGNVVTISTTSMLIPLLSTIITAQLSGLGISFTLLVAAGLVVIGSTICRRGVVD